MDNITVEDARKTKGVKFKDIHTLPYVATAFMYADRLYAKPGSIFGIGIGGGYNAVEIPSFLRVYVPPEAEVFPVTAKVVVTDYGLA